VRSWPLRPDPAQCRVIRTRFFTGARVYNAVLGEFIRRSRVVKADPAWDAARRLPRRTKKERAARRAAFDAVAVAQAADGLDRLDLEAANHGWLLHRHDVDGLPRTSRTALSKRRGRRHPSSRRSVARIKARRKAKAAMRQSRSARTSTTNRPTAIAA
jgi:hypothetical protein